MWKGQKLCEENSMPAYLNMSCIWDTLIRAATKYTDSHASDLLVDYETVMQYIRNYDGGEKSFIFGMRTAGVDHAELVFRSCKEIRLYGKIFQLDVKHPEFSDYIQVELWEVSYTYDEMYNNAVCTFAGGSIWEVTN